MTCKTFITTLRFDKERKMIKVLKLTNGLRFLWVLISVCAAEVAMAQSAAVVRAEPNWLAPYPRAQLRKQYVDPLKRTSIPLSQPATVNADTTRYMVRMEGKTTMLQYRHEADDSPLLIQRHYDAVLAQAGFERVVVCVDACPKSGGGAFWMQSLDPKPHQMDYFFFPNAPIVLVGHKSNAMVFVAIGPNSNFPYATFIKIVEGQYLNRSELQEWLDSLKPANVATPSTPALIAPSAQRTQIGAPLPSVGPLVTFQSDVVEVLSPARVTELMNQSSGKIVLLFSSRDSNCRFCVAANSRYAELAKAAPQAARYVVTFWEPWLDAFKAPPLQGSSIVGLPAYLVLEEGKLINRVDGNDTAVPLKEQIFDRRNPNGFVGTAR
jgi:hypothetical protein